MQLPPHIHLAESDVLEMVERVVRLLAPKCRIPGHDLDDVKQEARLMCLECLPRWDGVRPLENFMFSHLRRRLTNLRRDRWRRYDAPCRACDSGNFCGPDGRPCELYEKWRRRQDRKSAVRNPSPMDFPENTVVDGRADAAADAEVSELERLIDDVLPLELRPTYLKLRAGLAVDTAARRKVQAAVREILDGAPTPGPGAGAGHA